MYIKINSNIKQYLPVDVRILQRIFGPSTNRRCNKSKILLGTHKGLQCHVSLVQLLDVCDYPTVMFSKSSISGFLIVAACVMTFEARDSATKIAPTASAMQKDQVGPDTLANLFYSHVFV